MKEEINLEPGKAYSIKVDGLELFILTDDGAFICLLDYAGVPIMRFKRKAVPVIRHLLGDSPTFQ